MAYTREQLRKIFQNKFDREAWKAIVVDIFGANKVRRENELFTTSDEPETGYYMGSIDTPDAFRIGLFYYKINTGSVAHKKVGLRNLVKRFINQNWGEFDAAIVVFDDSQDWRLSFVCDIKEEATAPKRFTYVFGETDNLYRTAIERFTILQSQKPTFENMRKAFSVDALSDDFFDEYRNLYATFVEYITGKRYVKERNKWVERKVNDPDYQYETTFGSDDRLVRDYIKKLFGRIVFLYFLQRKGWLDGNRQYMHDLFFYSPKKDDFLDAVLEPLFFEVLNTDKPYRTEASKELPGSENIPYLNGGLFARDETDALNCVFPEILFKQLFDFLDSYNFTIDENDPEDAEIGIDPEMLGRIFENLLEDNKDKGAFYTPKEIVAYMCRESIIAYLLNGIPARSHDLIRTFVDTLDSSQLNDEQRHFIKNKLSEVKICDPAIGSGAFPMGMVNLLSKLYTALGLVSDHANMKRYIMERSIYGVDIEKGAVDIARLRFWLAMVVDAEKPEPLPNLHFKIMQGNSLLESYQGFDLQAISNTSDTNNTVWNAEAAVMLRKDIDAFYNTSDHSIRYRRLYQICNSVKTQLINLGIKEEDLAGVDPSATDRFFLWHTWFAPIFKQGGFDIVIGNPPYFVYQDTHKGEITELRKEKDYKIAFGGKLNAYKLFLANALERICKPRGIVTLIFQNSFLGDLQAANLRRYTLERTSIIKIDSFPERDSKKKRVFESVKMSVCILCTKNEPSSNNYKFPVSIWEDRYMEKGLHTAFSFNEVSRIDHENMTIPRLASSDIPLVIKLNECRGLSLKCIEGELNMTFHKKYFGACETNPIILKGAAIQRYKITLQMSQGEIEYLNERNYLKDCGTSEKSEHHNLERIAMQGMTGANDEIRLIMTIVPPGYYLANSCNYLFAPKGVDIHALLAILNSKLMNWYFRRFSTNSNVNGYEVDNFPIPRLSEDYMRILSNLAHNAICTSIIDELDKISNKIDHIVYHLYGLTYDEVLVVDPATPITREEYESRNVKKSIDS